MRANPGPGGTLVAEIAGAGVSFFLRRTVEGVPVIQHGGSWAGQYSGFFFVPERAFAMTLLTNSEGGGRLRQGLFYDDWALARFARLHNPQPRRRAWSPRAWRPTRACMSTARLTWRGTGSQRQ